MLALQGTFVLWETLDSLVLTRYIIDLLVYQTHIALNELRDELFDQEIIDYSTSSWEQIGQNILWYTTAWLGWLQSGMCFWGSAYAPRNGATEKGSSQSDIQPLRAALESMVFKHQESMLIQFVHLFLHLFICLFHWQRARWHHLLHWDMQNLHWMVGAYIYNIVQQSGWLVSLRKLFGIYALAHD